VVITKHERAGGRLKVPEQAEKDLSTVRRCVHSSKQQGSAEYGGEQYVAALKRLKGSAAVRAASQVEPFFWEDAKKVRVWLCAGCAMELGLG
jgi:hypothetical protein